MGVHKFLSESDSSPESLRDTNENALSCFLHVIVIIGLEFIDDSKGDDAFHATSDLDRLRTLGQSAVLTLLDCHSNRKTGSQINGDFEFVAKGIH